MNTPTDPTAKAIATLTRTTPSQARRFLDSLAAERRAERLGQQDRDRCPICGELPSMYYRGGRCHGHEEE